ncbi:MAG TPA: sulfatase-like hydrolase/transferase, partial [Vicinamibacteria bacterium]|nr:sulfatase-like hydrolase/transferase [Vicinamibacteria bacterium]
MFPCYQRCLLPASLGFAFTSCGGSNLPVLVESETPIHLEDHLESARVDSAPPPTVLPGQRDWTFEEENASWKPLSVPAPPENGTRSRGATVPSCTLAHEDGALRVSLSEASRFGDVVIGGVYTELDEGEEPDPWGAIVLRARASDRIRGAAVLLELEDDVISESAISSLMASSEIAPAFSDGTLLTYVFPARLPEGLDEDERATRLGIAFAVPRASRIDIVSVTAIPAAEQLTWATTMSLGDSYGLATRSSRRSLYAHTPARVLFRVEVPEAGRLDFGLGVVREDLPVTFTITVRPEGGAVETLFQESYSNSSEWGQRSLDLARFSGSVVSLSLQAAAERDGTVASWSAPTLSGARRSDKPNVILYIIDGAGADFMSVTGYKRATTPRLEEIAGEGALFERAHSNSTWTQPSTASFVTSLHHSVLGGFRPESSPVPPSVTTLAEHLHAGGYLTAAFTSNPNAALSIGPEHGTDVIEEVYERDHPSSVRLHERFWGFREHYPAEPYWAHFQTTDVHAPYPSVNPFAGRYVSAERRAKLAAWESEIQGGAVWSTSIFAGYREELARAGIDAQEFYEMLRGLYDEAMTQQDDQVGRF